MDNDYYMDRVSELDLSRISLKQNIPNAPRITIDDIEYLMERVSHSRHLASQLMTPTSSLYYLEQRAYLFEVMKTMLTALKILVHDDSSFTITEIDSIVDLTDELCTVTVAIQYHGVQYRLKAEYVKKSNAFFLSDTLYTSEEWHFIDQYVVKYGIYSYDMVFPYPSRFRQILQDSFIALME